MQLQSVTPQEVESRYEALLARVSEASKQNASEAQWEQLLTDWNKTRAWIDGIFTRTEYILAQNVTHSETEKHERYLREEVRPRYEALELKWLEAVLSTPLKDAANRKYGPQLMNLAELGQRSIANVNSALRVEEAAQSKEYQRLTAIAEVEVLGEKMTLSKARGLVSAPDAKVREAAFRSSREWVDQHRAPLSKIYSSLVTIRDRMGRNLGDPNFERLGYNNMGRTDYGPKQADEFRALVRKYFVPIVREMHLKRAHALGTERLNPWDHSFDPHAAFASNAVPVGTQIAAASRAFARISPRLSAHFQRMIKEDLIDLPNRPGKAPGAFCTRFADTKQVAILCNSTGEIQDIKTLLHECGHAFQMWESIDKEAIDLQVPTADAAEIHSMSMEFIGLSTIDEFLPKDLQKKYVHHQWSAALDFFCYGAIVDEFQHWVYRNPTATENDRDAKWNEIQGIYLPAIAFDKVGPLASTRWYIQAHIFVSPFYYLDYMLAYTAAMQMALLYEQSPVRALDRYVALCQLGGSASFFKVLDSASLRSPLEEQLIAEIADHAKAQLMA